MRHLRLPLAQGGVQTSCRRSPPRRCTKAVTKPKHIAERWRVVFRCCMSSRFSRCHPRIRASTRIHATFNAHAERGNSKSMFVSIAGHKESLNTTSLVWVYGVCCVSRSSSVRGREDRALKFLCAVDVFIPTSGRS